MALMFIVVAANAIAAANVPPTTTLRAGEHGDYSRIVIPKAPPGWSFSLQGRAIDIGLPGNESLDLRALNELRQAHRVLSAQVSGTGVARRLQIRITCDCATTASLSETNNIIIDIRDNAARNELAQPTADAPDRSRENLRARMASLIAEANNDGFVTLKGETERHANDTNGQPTDTASDEQEVGPLELPNNKKSEIVPIVLQPADCIDATPLLPNSDDPSPGYAEIARLRSILEAAEGEEDNTALLSLARAYLSLGFFEEAHAIGANSVGDHIELEFVGNVASLASNITSGESSYFQPRAHCGELVGALAAAEAAKRGASIHGLNENRIEAIKLLAPALRAPIAELLAIGALKENNRSLANKLREIASSARDGRNSPALSVLNASLQSGQNSPEPFLSDLADVARSPGPLQPSALLEIANQTEESAPEPYEGFFDDIAELPDGTAKTTAAKLAGAKSLAANGQLLDALELLSRIIKNDAESKSQAKKAAQAFFYRAIKDEKNTYPEYGAVDAFLRNMELLDNPDAIRFALDKLSKIGAEALISSVLDTDNGFSSDERIKWKAISQLRSGVVDNAAPISKLSSTDNQLNQTIIRLAERRSDEGLLNSWMRNPDNRQKAASSLVDAAWRRRDWRGAAKIYAERAPEYFDAASARRSALAALSLGDSAIPKNTIIALENTDQFEGLEHMFAPAPSFKPFRPLSATRFTDGVRTEITMIEEALTDE
ncbi:MAG: hypothetical protein AAGB02_08245 [Pseudomonadota bacterium]